MVFIETRYFSRLLASYLSDDEYRALQRVLLLRPSAGVVIRGSGGARKIRWTVAGKGKSGGVRVIYYWAARREQVFMLAVYSKSEKANLGPAELRVIAELIGQIEHG